MRTESSRIVGLDIGGSKTHAIAAAVGGTADGHEVLAGSASLSSVGAAEAERQLASVFNSLGRDGIVAVCAGAAGVDSPEQEDRLRALVQAQVPAAVVRIVHDTHLILAAAGVESGIAVISGTGSVAWGRTPTGVTARAGGWGYRLGDEGSGYWVAQQAVRHALGRADRGERPDRLSRQLLAACGLPDAGQLLDHFYARPERDYWARHSSVVFDAAGDGDPVSTQIVTKAGAALVQLVRTVGGRLDLTTPVVLGGGLLVQQPLLQDLVRTGLAADGFTDVRVISQHPVQGAVTLARALAVTPAAR